MAASSGQNFSNHTTPPSEFAARRSSNEEDGRIVVGLTGGIGAGKSEVGRILADLGCEVSVADEMVRDILAHDPFVRETLRDWWGDVIFADDEGQIDRVVIASIVFADSAQRKRLENLLHPLVHLKRMEDWSMAEADRGASLIPAFVIDAPLLFEAGLMRLCDCVVFVDADPKTRLQRVMSTRGWSEDDLHQREKTQISLDTKRQQSDYHIRNNTTIDALKQNVKDVLDRIVRDL